LNIAGAVLCFIRLIFVFKFSTLTILEKVQAVEAVFKDLDDEISNFQDLSGLHCKWGCGKCCFKPDIEATVLEFLPFAHYLYQQDLGFAWLEKLKENPELCLILNPTSDKAGLCSQYPHRGLICRLFGYSARTNKYGSKELVTCQIIKTEQSEAYERAQAQIAESGGVPVMNQYYMRLHGIDQQLAQDFYPVNQAIKRALETVLHYYAYRN
jgi:Fe-S-cluster containining protein